MEKNKSENNHFNKIANENPTFPSRNERKIKMKTNEQTEVQKFMLAKIITKSK